MNRYLVGAIVGILALAGFGYGCYHAGSAHTQAEWDASNDEAYKAQLVGDIKAGLVTTQIVTQYMDRVQIIYAQGAVITKEVTNYVTKTDDAKCTIDNGFVWLHNAAATGSALPGSAGASDAAGLALSDVAGVVASNYGVCRATAEQLTQLQAWVRAQAAILGPTAKP